MLTSKNVKITVSSDATSWGTSFAENGLFILLEIAGTVSESAPQKGKEILDLLLTKITNYKQRDLTTIKDIVNGIKENKAVKTLTLGFSEGDVIYLANLGTGEVLLQRNKTVGKILLSGETASGKILAGDRLLFSTKTFLGCIEKEKQQEIISSQDLAGGAEVAYSVLIGNPSSVGAAAFLLEFEEKKDISEAEGSFEVPKKKDYKKFLKQSWLSFREKLSEDGEDVKQKKTLLTIAVILILLLVASVFLNISHSQSANKQNKLKQTLELVSHQYDEAVSLIDLNPARARILLSDSKLSLSQIFKEFSKDTSEYKEINEWLNKIAEKEVAAYKIFRFTNVPLFFDINLIKNNGSGNKIAVHQKTAVILDSQNKTVYSFSLDTKKAGIIAGSEVVKDAQTVAVHGNSAYLLNADGIVQIDLPTKAARVIIKPDKNWGEIKELVAFGGNLYLLDKKNNTVWKYIATDNGFSARASYLNPDVSVSFAGAQKMIVDGSVWVLSDSSTILKFTNGRGEAFSFKGVADTISNIATFYTSDEDKNLYVLDKQTLRILVFDKDGEYQSQYQWEELKNVADLAVSESEGKIFVLSGGKIYALDLK